MILFLAYSYSAGLSENESAEIYKLVSRNRKQVYISVTKFISDLKRKVKILYIYLVFTTSNPMPYVAYAGVILPIPICIHRSQPNNLDQISADKIYSYRSAPIIVKSYDKVVYRKEQIDEFNEIYGKFLNGSRDVESIEELILKLRAGDL